MESNKVIVGHFVTDVIRMVTPSNKANKQLFAQNIHERFTHHKLELYSPEFVAINETKCNDVSFRKLFAIHKLEGYKIEHKERKNGQGGGVAFLIKEHVNYSLEKEYDSFELELLCLKINLKNSNFLVFSYYNPPNTEPKKEFFQKLYESKVDFVLAGDLNSKNKILLNSNFCVLNDKSPTHCHFTTQKEDILDLFIASPCFYSKKVEFSSLKKHDMGSDHCPVLLKLKFEFDLYEKDINNLKKLDLNKAE
ncbi:RNA-directed DNA polymerase from mobile element jockey-like [Brachionus plicatilis]|uniref:RNA-directed DNA polymerase from mobile element jockey-like n=1 Tax=Brachionus plicatilis TaxID=10195 RepID=A0A3M7R929_BRAPC|nr:RNA-directed DNA polymerase from mobile element jockey-like [Brachionus plicatilis]